ncbi:Uncharacterized protein dnm_064890 [Desulfonema magnum]|uniref:Uncharacterized protein n=1 Tax=Desulfonema magnum TaxID=45655 RepID=A0A975BRT7_9BACT|nr:Uncharacterized protein dnm_064890 [Desulfonema magnum]
MKIFFLTIRLPAKPTPGFFISNFLLSDCQTLFLSSESLFR